MSCKHGNHENACDICDEVDAAYESGLAARLAAPAVANRALPEPFVTTLGSGNLYSEDQMLAAIEAAAAPNAALVAALQEALSVIQDYLDYDHDGDPWKEDARIMGEMDINDYARDGRLEKARAALSAIGVKP